MSYPIDELLAPLSASLVRFPNVVLQAPPGAGKTTRIPLALLAAEWLNDKKIIMLEPRRIAARTAARFMAASLREAVGETVGYQVRLERKVGPNTRIEVVTEGILTRILQDDPALEDYAVVIFDEFHERNLNSDLALALCLDAQQGLREDLRLIVMSATLDGEAVARLLDDAPILTSAGRSYPVETRYLPVASNFARDRRGFMQELTRHILYVLEQEEGSVLVFLPGAGEIRQLNSALQQSLLAKNIILAPLFGQQSPQEQDASIQPAPAQQRKIVLATAIAETSLTIEGIRIVIDAGLMRTPRFNPNTGLTQLLTLSVSQASADQRAGRAGRTQPGVCYRLWSQATPLLPYSNPEIIDADLVPLMLELALWGVSKVTDLRWLDLPPIAHVAQANALLQQLAAVNAKGQITAHGKAMAKWGAHPRLTHMMLCAKKIGVGVLACEIAALLSERDVIKGRHRESDLRMRVEALRDRQPRSEIDQGARRQVNATARQWMRQLLGQSSRSSPSSIQDDSALTGVVLAYAYPDRIGRQRDNNPQGMGQRFLLSNGRGALLGEEDMLCTQVFIVAAHLQGARDARIFLAAGIHYEHIMQYHRDLLKTQHFVQWDDKNSCVLARQQFRVGEVIVNDQLWKEAESDAIKNALLAGIRIRGMRCLPWKDASLALQARVIFLHENIDNSWPNFADTALLETLEEWLAPYLEKMSRISHLQKLDLLAILLACLPWELQGKLDELAPTHITVPSGSPVRIDYTQSPPVLAVRLQEVFGLVDTPRIANGKMAVRMHLLSPARRPVQITQDLAGFWQSSYHAVKKDMKGRYPKHHWPDNPLEAQATARVKRKK